MLALTFGRVRLEAAERFQAIENVPQNGSLGDKILPSNEAQVRPLSQLGTHRPTRAHLPVADDQIEHTGGLAVQWCRVWCRSWPPMRSIEYRTGRRYPRRLAGAVLRDVCQCLDSDSHLPFQQSRQRRPHGRRVCVLGSSWTPCAWTMSTVFHGLIPFDCFSSENGGAKVGHGSGGIVLLRAA